VNVGSFGDWCECTCDSLACKHRLTKLMLWGLLLVCAIGCAWGFKKKNAAVEPAKTKKKAKGGTRQANPLHDDAED